MEFDRALLKKIHDLPDDSLRDAILSVAGNMGIDPALAAGYLTDMEKIKSTVASLTEEDLSRVEGAIGEENTKVLMDKIRKEVQG